MNAELLDGLARMTFLANSKPGTTPPKPLEIQRPARPLPKRGSRGSTLTDLLNTKEG